MLYNYSIKNYREFKNIFERTPDGRLVNKILLSFWKYRYKIDKDFRATRIKTMQDLINLVFSSLELPIKECKYPNYLNLQDKIYYLPSNVYRIFNLESAICLTDKRCLTVQYEYYNKIKDTFEFKKLKIKAGKFFQNCVAESGARLDMSTVIYCSEIFQSEWETYSSQFSDLSLHIDDNFDFIYNGASKDFGSCMSGKNRNSFYHDKVEAKAAYLTNPKGELLVRCVLFTNVFGENDKVYRYAERQYSVNNNLLYKKLLIQALINGGHIDIYKNTIASCRDIVNILKVNGEPFTEPISINCYLKDGDVRSFMDTFIFYNYSKSKASNNLLKINPGRKDEIYSLNTTQDIFHLNSF